MGIGEVMRALGVGKVLVSKHPGFQAGDYVNGAPRRAGLFHRRAQGFLQGRPVPAPLPRYLSALGMTGMTAYFALLDVGQPKNGETVVISRRRRCGGQRCRADRQAQGLPVVGIAGGAEKCRFLVEELGFDGAIDYKNEDLAAGLKRECPKGIDVFFDNVGGEILDTVLTRIAFKARIVLCGAISQYNNKGSGARPGQLPVAAGQSGAHGRHGGDGLCPALPRRPEGRWPPGWRKASCNRARTSSKAWRPFPETLLKLFSGENFGKLVLKV